MRTVALAAALTCLLAACQGGKEEGPSEEDTAILEALVDFARSPSDAASATVPFAERVHLGLADRLLERRAAGGEIRAITLDLYEP